MDKARYWALSWVHPRLHPYRWQVALQRCPLSLRDAKSFSRCFIHRLNICIYTRLFKRGLNEGMYLI